MLTVGGSRLRKGSHFTRRAFVEAGFSSMLGLSWADSLSSRELGNNNGSAKSVILLWLWGGPAHLDTWDPKPQAPLEFRGPFASIPTNVTGIRIAELFPQIAKRADRMAIIRSMKTQSNDHGVAGTIGLTGSSSGSVNLGGNVQTGAARPALGAIVGRSRGLSSTLPSYLVVGGKLHQGKKTIIGEGGGVLGGAYDPFRLVYGHQGGFSVPALDLPADLPAKRLEERRKLTEAFDAVSRDVELCASSQAINSYRRQAFAMLTSPSARKQFDLSAEPDAVRSRYGRTRFGQSCLLARRLVEHGVPFVQVNWSDHVEAEEDSGDGGWDHHYRNFQLMQDRHAPWLDQSLSALLDDLAARGMLESTLVLAVGEFGRSPKINDKAGREHWEHCYSALLAGGGIRGGQVIGSSTARGEHVRDNPISPADLGATIQHAVGMSSEQAAVLGVSPMGRVVTELF